MRRGGGGRFEIKKKTFGKVQSTFLKIKITNS